MAHDSASIPIILGTLDLPQYDRQEDRIECLEGGYTRHKERENKRESRSLDCQRSKVFAHGTCHAVRTQHGIGRQ